MADDGTALDLGAAAGDGALDPRVYLRILWRRKLLLLAFLVVIPVGAYLYEHSRPKVYRSSVVLSLTGNQPTVSSLFNPAAQASAPNLAAEALVIQTPATASRAAQYLNPRPANPTSLLGDITATGDVNTGFLTVTASAPSPNRAADIANAFSGAVVADAARSAKKNLTVAINQLEAQLRGIPQSNPGRLQVASQLAQFRALRRVQQAGAQVIEAATPNPAPVSPRITRSVLLALIVALLLGLGVVALVDAADRRLRDADEVDQLVGVPLLSAVPASAFSSHPSHEAEEAFATLRAALTYFNVDRPITSVLITSPHQEEGKTTVAVGLARALARAGRDVILLDADMRRPAAAERFGLGAHNGLGAVLIDELPLDEALLVVEDENFRGRLRVLPAGPPPPNPSELLGSRRMQQLLSDLTERSGIVLIDSTPLLTVSDSMPLVRVVSGVALIGRMNRTSRDAIIRLRQVVSTAGGHPLGVVTTGATAGGLYVGAGYGYGYGYGYRNGSAYAARVSNGNGKRPDGRSRWKRMLDREEEVRKQ